MTVVTALFLFEYHARAHAHTAGNYLESAVIAVTRPTFARYYNRLVGDSAFHWGPRTVAAYGPRWRGSRSALLVDPYSRSPTRPETEEAHTHARKRGSRC